VRGVRLSHPARVCAWRSLRTAPRSGRGRGRRYSAPRSAGSPTSSPLRFAEHGHQRTIVQRATGARRIRKPGRQGPGGRLDRAQGDRPVRPEGFRIRGIHRQRGAPGKQLGTAQPDARPGGGSSSRRESSGAGNRDLAAQSRRSLDRNWKTLQLGDCIALLAFGLRVCSHLGISGIYLVWPEPFTSAADYCSPALSQRVALGR